MNHYYDFTTPICNATVAFGRFDGMHIGHRTVLDRLTSFNNPVLVSFEDDKNKVINTEAEKEYILKSYNIEYMITVAADIYEKMDVCEFVEKYLVGRLNAHSIVVGENYYKIDELKDVCHRCNISIEIVPTVKINDEDVTTDLIKKYFHDGDMNECLKLLGGKYVMAGRVIHGKGKGRKHGMPTANLTMASNKLWPRYGVYGTTVHIKDYIWDGVTNVGFRPSDDDIPIPTCETYIIEFQGDIYNIPLVLEAFTYVRPVMRFSNLDEVRLQIDKDIEQIRVSQEKRPPDSPT